MHILIGFILLYQNELGKTIEYEEGKLQDNGRIKLEFPNETLQGESQSMILVILMYRYQ
ncbi:MAG: hypothetical protein ACXWFB_02785 [Nitrososphaeraceae archaeon]